MFEPRRKKSLVVISLYFYYYFYYYSNLTLSLFVSIIKILLRRTHDSLVEFAVERQNTTSELVILAYFKLYDK